jgi:hypothetical protein
MSSVKSAVQAAIDHLRGRGVGIPEDMIDDAVNVAEEVESDANEDAWDAWDPDEDPMYAGDGTWFAQEDSALRASGPGNPRNLPCPTCREPNRLTPADRARGYQCDSCADKVERGWME